MPDEPARPRSDSARAAGGPPSQAERARLAAEALAQAKADAQARGESPPRRRRAARAAGNAGDDPAAWGAAGPGTAAAPPGPPEDAVASGGTFLPGGAVGSGSAGPPGAGGPDGGGARAGGAAGGTAAGSTAAARAGRAGPAGRPRRARQDDPQPLRAAIGRLLDERGWQGDLAVGGVFGRWGEIVGAELAAHTRPEGLAGGELLVTADSTAWATQVRLLAGTLAARVNAELGNTVVRRVKVRGPAPPPRSGPWRVRGGRGPRDDYG